MDVKTAPSTAAPTTKKDDGALTVDDKKRIRTSWELVAQDLTGNGVTLFKNIFEIAPGAKALFSFGKDTDLYKSRRLMIHATGVMKTVGAAVDNLDDLAPIVPVLTKLGKKHAKYKVVPEHFPIVGEALLKTLDQGLGKLWTGEMKASWVKLWVITVSVMKPALIEGIEEATEAKGKKESS